jgi:protein-L-isoaspartate(D-aspartate) O-methyltransferase
MDADASDATRRETDGAAGGAAQDSAAARRARMVERQLVARGIRDPDVLAAMRAVPRHLFVPEELRHAAYDDSPLPIGFGQTISQPYMVACMTEAVRVNVRSRVLDVGAGSGYQTAVLAELAGEVFAVERVAVLEEQARERLATMGYDNVVVKLGDGSLGWSEHAPFDGIIVAAAAAQAPPPLLDQLAEGGRLVVPLGDAHRDQVLTIYERHGDDFVVERGLRCRFVPLVGERPPANADEPATGAGPAGDDAGGDDLESPGRWEEVEP